ncbi:MAG: hypothetical protein P8K08_19995 [Fuerstiella sp.]|nr:hypothetical protein [Fuerstiella sp.]
MSWIPAALKGLWWDGRGIRRNRRRRTAHLRNPLQDLSTEVLENRVLLATQLIASDVAITTVAPDETFDVPVVYQTLNDSDDPAALQATLFSFNLHFDADALTFVETRDVFAEGLLVTPDVPRLESDPTVLGDDNLAATDTVLVTSYADTDPTVSLGWPNSPVANGQTLYVATFTAKAGFSGTTISFSANQTGNVIGQPAEFSFLAAPLTIHLPAVPPVVTSPLGAIDNHRPTLTWTEVSGANSYEVWLEQLGGVGNPVVNPTVVGNSYTLSADLDIGRYRTWIRANLAAGGTTVWGTGDFQIQTATVINPLPVYGDDPTPTISWSPVVGATSYRVFIDNFTAGGILVADETVTETSFTPTLDFEFGRHHIWVRANGVGNYAAAWSDRAQYYIGPEQLSPLVSTFDTQPLFSWTTLPDVASTQLWVQRGSTVVLTETGLTGTQFNPSSPFTSGAYRWWIRPWHTSGRGGEWSQLGEFFVGGRPTVISPSGTVNDSLPTITWEAVEGAGSYEIYLFNDDGLGLIHRAGGITGTSYSSFPLADGNYRVWIKSYNTNGDSGLWSRSLSFAVDASTSSTSATPTSPLTPTFDTTPTFEWTADATAASSELYLTDGQTVVSLLGLTGTNWTPTTPLATSQWRWWVRARDASNAAGPWSAAATTDTSGRAVVLGPSGTTSDLTPTVVWKPVIGASHYVLQVDNLTTGQNSIIRENTLTATSYTPVSDLTPGDYRAWVRAINGNNDSPGPWSFNVEFTVAVVDKTVIDNPEGVFSDQLRLSSWTTPEEFVKPLQVADSRTTTSPIPADHDEQRRPVPAEDTAITDEVMSDPVFLSVATSAAQHFSSLSQKLVKQRLVFTLSLTLPLEAHTFNNALNERPVRSRI